MKKCVQNSGRGCEWDLKINNKKKISRKTSLLRYVVWGCLAFFPPHTHTHTQFFYFFYFKFILFYRQQQTKNKKIVIYK